MEHRWLPGRHILSRKCFCVAVLIIIIITYCRVGRVLMPKMYKIHDTRQVITTPRACFYFVVIPPSKTCLVVYIICTWLSCNCILYIGLNEYQYSKNIILTNTASVVISQPGIIAELFYIIIYCNTVYLFYLYYFSAWIIIVKFLRFFWISVKSQFVFSIILFMHS